MPYNRQIAYFHEKLETRFETLRKAHTRYGVFHTSVAIEKLRVYSRALSRRFGPKCGVALLEVNDRFSRKLQRALDGAGDNG